MSQSSQAGRDGAPGRTIGSVAVIGAGAEGADIAMKYLDAGVQVTLLETGREALERGVALIRKRYEAQVTQRTLREYKYAVRMAFLRTSLNFADIESADLVIESHAPASGVMSQA